MKRNEFIFLVGFICTALAIPACEAVAGYMEEREAERNRVYTVHTERQAITGSAAPCQRLEFFETVELTATAYCSCAKCCGWSTGITYSGEQARPGHTIAANLEEFPLGTVLEINGTEYTVEDTGRLAPGVVDIYFSTHEEAVAFGVQKVTAYKK